MVDPLMSSAFRTPPLGALRAFEAVARLGSLNRAAEELHVTKSAISHQLRSLESELGVVLLHRGGTLRRAEPTEAGTEFLIAVRHALALLDAACRSVRAVSKGKLQRVLKVSANPSLASLWLAPRLGKFTQMHPDIQIQVHLHSHREPDWHNGVIDLAIMHMRVDDPESIALTDIPLLVETVIPVCCPSLVDAADRDDPLVLLRHRLIQEQHIASPETAWSTWRRHLNLPSLNADEALVLAGLSTIVGAAAAGAGIALGRSPLVDAELASGRLVALLSAHRMAGSWGYVMRVQPNRTVDPSLHTLMSFLEKEGGMAR